MKINEASLDYCHYCHNVGFLDGKRNGLNQAGKPFEDRWLRLPLQSQWKWYE